MKSICVLQGFLLAFLANTAMFIVGFRMPNSFSRVYPLGREESLFMRDKSLSTVGAVTMPRQPELLTKAEETLYSRQFKIKAGIEERKHQLEISSQRKISDQELANDLGIGLEKLRMLLQKGEEARSKLYHSNFRLIYHISRFYQFRGIPLSDLYHEGAHGLIKAIERYDPEKGFRFSTYASWWIRQSISRGLAEKSRMVRIPSYTHEILSTVYYAERQLEQEYGRAPTVDEISSAVNISTSKIKVARKSVKKIQSLDAPTFTIARGDKEESTRTKSEVTSAEFHTPQDKLTADNIPSSMLDMLYKLSRRECHILILRYGLAGSRPLTLGEIGEKFNITKERARQIEASALQKLKDPAMVVDKIYEEVMKES